MFAETLALTGLDNEVLDAQVAEWWREGWKEPEDLEPWEWAEKYIRFPDRQAATKPGPYSTEFAPYVREIMEAFKDPTVRKIVICFPTQSSKTITMLVLMLWALVNDPGPNMWAMPSQDLANEFSKMRVKKCIDENPEVAKIKTGNRHDFGNKVMIFDRSSLFLQGANSPTQASSKGILHLFLDETDKYPTETAAEADPLSNFLERVKDFPDHKIVISSTPTTSDGVIWRELKASDFRKWHVTCPSCGEEFVWQWPHIKWDRTNETNPEAVRRSAYGECPHCRHHIPATKRWAVSKAGRWAATNPEAPKDVRGYHLGGMVTMDWGKMAWAWIDAMRKAKFGDTGPLHAFVNSSLAEPWERRMGAAKKPDEMRAALGDDRPRGLVPNYLPVAGLTAGIDTQDYGFYYVVRAWGYGETQESWLVREGFVESLSAVDEVLNTTYLDPAGMPHSVNLALIDSQGHRTAEVYEWCAGRSLVRPSKGAKTLSAPWKPANITHYPNSTKPIPGGILLYHVDTTHWKDRLAQKMAVRAEDPGAWHVHGDVPDEYFQHLAAEYVDPNEGWVCPKDKANHYWDCEVLAITAADMENFKYQEAPPDTPESDYAVPPSRPW